MLPGILGRLVEHFVAWACSDYIAPDYPSELAIGLLEWRCVVVFARGAIRYRAILTSSGSSILKDTSLKVRLPSCSTTCT